MCVMKMCLKSTWISSIQGVLGGASHHASHHLCEEVCAFMNASLFIFLLICCTTKADTRGEVTEGGLYIGGRARQGAEDGGTFRNPDVDLRVAQAAAAYHA